MTISHTSGWNIWNVFLTLSGLLSSSYHYSGSYRKLPKLTTLVTFGISSIWGLLLSGIRYSRGFVTFGGTIFSGVRYFRGFVTLGGSLLSGVWYFRRFVTFGDSLLSEVYYFRGVVTFEGLFLSGFATLRKHKTLYKVVCHVTCMVVLFPK